MDAVRHRFDEVAEELSGFHLAGALDQPHEDEFAGSVDGHEQPELALSGADLGDVDVDVADGVTRKALLLGLVAVDLGQSADAVTFQTAMQRGPGQVRDRRLQTIEAVVEREQRVPSESDDDRLLLEREHGGARLFGSHPGIRRRRPFAPLLHRRRTDAVAPGQRPYAFFT